MSTLSFWYSCVNAGKSTQLLQMNHAYISRGLKTLLYTSSKDTRSGGGLIRSRLGIEALAIGVDDDMDIFNHFKRCTLTTKYDAVFVDEAQFLTTEQVLQLCKICDELGTNIYAFGLRTNFRGEPFVGSALLLSLADEIREVPTVDAMGDKAVMSLRTDEDGRVSFEGETVRPGFNYRPASRRAFFKALADTKKARS